MSRTCASRYARASILTISSPSTTSSATIIISAPTTTSPSSTRIARTTASTIRSDGRSLALGRLFGRDSRDPVSGGMGPAAAAISGHRSAGAAQRAGLRSGRQISRRRERALHALFPRPHPPVPILPGGLPPGGMDGSAPPLLLLQQSRGRPAAERDARHGRLAAVAGRARSLYRHPRNVRRRDDRLFPAFADLAAGAESRPPVRLAGPLHLIWWSGILLL